MRLTLGGATLVATAIAYCAWIWLPGAAEGLAHQRASLEGRLQAVQSTPSIPQPMLNGRSLDPRTLPAASTLVRRAGLLLDDVTGAGGRQVRYTLSAPTAHGAHVSRDLTVTFAADLLRTAAVFEVLHDQGPAVQVRAVTMEREDAGQIGVEITLHMLGRA